MFILVVIIVLCFSHQTEREEADLIFERLVMKHNDMVFKSLQKGDIIRIPRGIYDHFAIYIGDGYVVHFGKDEKWNIYVKMDDFFEVCKDSYAEVCNYYDNIFTPFDSKEIVARAKSMIGKSGYNLLTNNCEHLATFCRNGIKFSQQVDTVTEVSKVAMLLLLSLTVIIAIRILKEKYQKGKDQEPLLICQLRTLTDRCEREHQAANQYLSANNSLCPVPDTSLAIQDYCVQQTSQYSWSPLQAYQASPQSQSSVQASQGSMPPVHSKNQMSLSSYLSPQNATIKDTNEVRRMDLDKFNVSNFFQGGEGKIKIAECHSLFINATKLALIWEKEKK